MYTTFSKECSVNIVKVGVVFPDQSNLIIEEPIEDRSLASYSIKKLLSIFRNQYPFY